MRGFGFLAILLLVWTVISYIIISIMAIPFSSLFVNLGSLGTYAGYTVKYVKIVFANIVLFVLLDFDKNLKHAIGLVFIMEILGIAWEVS